MEKYEIFETLQRIETKIDNMNSQQQKRCDEISAEQRKKIDSKISASMFQWVVGFIVTGILALGTWVLDIGRDVTLLNARHKNFPTAESVGGDAKTLAEEIIK